MEKGIEQFVINRSVTGIGFISADYLNPVRDLAELKLAKGYGCQKGRAPQIGLDGILDLSNGSIQNIGMDLTPDIGIGTPADHVDDSAALSLNHSAGYGLAAEERSEQVDRNVPPPGSGVDLGHGTDSEETSGVVHQDVHGSESIFHRSHHEVDGGGVGNVRRYGECSSTFRRYLLGRFFELGNGPRYQSD